MRVESKYGIQSNLNRALSSIKMDRNFHDSHFETYFNILKYLGLWVPDSTNPFLRKLYSIYRVFANAVILFFSCLGILDMVYCFDNFRKLSYNLCINGIIIATWLKNLQVLHKSETINRLRKRLYRERKSCIDKEELNFCLSAHKHYQNLEKLFFGALFILCPSFLFFSYYSYKWGPRELPLPSRWLWEVDLRDPFVYNCLYTSHVIFVVAFLMNIIAIDMSMFSLLTQLFREYSFLIKQIQYLSVYYETCISNEVAKRKEEFNLSLKKKRTGQMLRDIILKQRELVNSTKDFEYSYNLSMFIQIFAGGFLITINGLQALIVSLEFSVKMSYQIGYVVMIIIDICYLCWSACRVSNKSYEVGLAMYAAPWYKMDNEFRKDISMIILLSQKPPRITSGKILELNLHTFMVMMKNIYSWLALFRQIGFK